MADSVAGETRRRGRADTRRLAWFIALAALLHLPFTPLGALIGLLSLLHAPSHELPPDALNAIPVSLLSPEEMAQMGMGEPPPKPAAPPEPAAPKPPADEPAADFAEPPPKPKPKPPKPKPKPKPAAVIADGGVPESPDGGAVLHAEKPQALVADGGGAPTPPVDAPKPGAGDPMALVGKATSVADPNANVKLLLLNDRIRGLPVGPRIGRLVAELPQWKSFFGPTGLDPIRDIDRMYVAGPQFRVSADVVAVLEYQVSHAKMRQAIDSIVKREPKGEWFDSPVPAARARADRADRVFVLPKGKVLLMVPPHLKDDAIAKAPHLGFPSVGGDAVAIAFIATPWRALAGLGVPFELTHTIVSAMLSLTPSEDGGAVLHVEAVEETADEAASDAALLGSTINSLTQRNVGALGALLFGGQTLSLIEPMSLRAVGKVVHGDARITPPELDRLLGFAEAWIDAMNGGPPPLPSAVPAPRPRHGAGAP